MTIKYAQMLGDSTYRASERGHSCTVWREGGKWYADTCPGEGFDTRSSSALAGLGAVAYAKANPPAVVPATPALPVVVPAAIQLYDVYTTDANCFVMRAPLHTISSMFVLHLAAVERIRVEAGSPLGCELHSRQLSIHTATGPLAALIPTNPEEM